MSTTEDRIESLENQLRDQQEQVRLQQFQVRRQRRWNIALGAVVVVGGLMAATGVRSVPDVIQAKKFEVVNDEGKVIVLIESVFSKGEHYGFVKTQNGKGGALVELGVTSGGNGMVKTQNGKGQILVELGATTKGYGAVETQNGKGQRLVGLGTNQMGGTVICTNAIGKNVAMIGARQEDGSGVVLTTDPAGKEFTSTNPSP